MGNAKQKKEERETSRMGERWPEGEETEAGASAPFLLLALLGYPVVRSPHGSTLLDSQYCDSQVTIC